MHEHKKRCNDKATLAIAWNTSEQQKTTGLTHHPCVQNTTKRSSHNRKSKTTLPCVQRKHKQFQTICMHPVHACATSPLNLPHNALEPMPMGTLPLRYFMPLPLDLTLPLLGTILLCPFPFPCPCLAPPMQRLPLPLRLAGGGPSGG